MKATGMTRRIDNLGRVVIPMELRKTLCLNEGDQLEILVDGPQIILQRYNPGMNLMATLHSIDEQAREVLDNPQAEQVHSLIKQLAAVFDSDTKA